MSAADTTKRTHSPPLSGLLRSSWVALRRFLPSRGAVATTLLAASVLAFVVSAWAYLHQRADNAAIAALGAGQDIAVDPARASSGAIAARVRFLLLHERLDEAQSLLDQATARLAPSARAAILYNMANARLRQAFADIERGQIDRGIPLIRIAKDEYRIALRTDPGNWDYKHNLDVAMRLIRDFPQLGSGDDDEDTSGPKPVWTDIPGVPKGLP